MLFNKEFYSKVKATVKGNWWKIFLVIVIINAIGGIINSIGIDYSKNFYNIIYYFEAIQYGYMDPEDILDIIRNRQFNAWILFSNLMYIVVSKVLFLGLSVNILGLVRNNVFETIGIIDTFRTKTIKLLAIGTIYALLIFVLSRIPIVGFIVTTVVTYGMCYLPYLIELNPDLDYIEYFKDSWNLTNGHKWRLFLIDFHYFGIPTVLFFCIFIFIIILFGMQSYGSTIFGIILMVVSSIVYVVIMIRNSVLNRVANAQYFDEQMKNVENV